MQLNKTVYVVGTCAISEYALIVMIEARRRRVGAVARDDIAEAIVAVLLGDGLDGRTYGVTASDAITIHEAAEKRSLVTGRSITYHAETLEEAYASRASFGAPEWEIEGWITSYAAIANGEMNVVSDTVSEPTGHAPMTITDFLRRYPESYQHLLNK